MADRRFKHWGAGVVALACAALGPQVARADALAELAEELKPGETNPDLFFETMEVLAEKVEDGSTPAKRNAARCLRVAAAADMWLLARLRHQPEMQGRIAEAMGVSVDSLPQVLQRSLAVFENSECLGSAEDTRRALGRLTGATLDGRDKAEGPREGLVLLLEAAHALDAPSPLEGLAALSSDPCARRSCPERFAHFGSEGRRAAQTLEQGIQAYKLANAARDSDRVLRQLSSLIDPAYERLLPLELQPDVRVGEGVRCDGCGRHRDLDLLILVQPDAVRISRAPRIHVGSGGKIESLVHAEPVWPRAQVVPLPETYPGYIKHIDAVVDAVAAFGTDLRVAVGASSDVPSHVWARVVLSARRGNADAPFLLARSAGGDSRVAPLRVVTAFGADKVEPSEVNVFVLMKGHSVRVEGESVTIDRVTTADGSSDWNFEAVAQRTGSVSASTAELRFLPNLPADTVLKTAVAMAPAQRPLTVILP